MCVAIILCVLLLAITAHGDVHYKDQEEQLKQQLHHLTYHRAQKREPDHYEAEEHISKHPVEDHLSEHQSQEHLPEQPLDHPQYQPEQHYKYKEHQPEEPVDHHKYLPEHSYIYKEHQLEEPIDQPKYQPEHHSYKEHEPEHYYAHHEPAKSYQNFNLHVGPQQIVRIPVYRHHTGHNEYKVPVKYPSHSLRHTHGLHQHP